MAAAGLSLRHTAFLNSLVTWEHGSPQLERGRAKLFECTNQTTPTSVNRCAVSATAIRWRAGRAAPKISATVVWTGCGDAGPAATLEGVRVGEWGRCAGLVGPPSYHPKRSGVVEGFGGWV